MRFPLNLQSFLNGLSNFCVEKVMKHQEGTYTHELQSSCQHRVLCRGRSSGLPPTEPDDPTSPCLHLHRGIYVKQPAAQMSANGAKAGCCKWWYLGLVVDTNKGSWQHAWTLDSHLWSLKEIWFEIFRCFPWGLWWRPPVGPDMQIHEDVVAKSFVFAEILYSEIKNLSEEYTSHNGPL